MPKASIYLTDALAMAVKASNMNLSAVCQRAIRAELARQEVGGPPVASAEMLLTELLEEMRGLRSDLTDGRNNA